MELGLAILVLLSIPSDGKDGNVTSSFTCFCCSRESAVGEAAAEPLLAALAPPCKSPPSTATAAASAAAAGGTADDGGCTDDDGKTDDAGEKRGGGFGRSGSS
jgi:hypothetical protein